MWRCNWLGSSVGFEVLTAVVMKLKSKSKLLYEWRLPPINSSWRQAPWGSRQEISFYPNPCGHSPYITSSLMRGWVSCLLGYNPVLKINRYFGETFHLHHQGRRISPSNKSALVIPCWKSTDISVKHFISITRVVEQAQAINQHW
jgi:hypothetical protein